MSKHVYLILAHNEWSMLQTLIDCIDDPRNDIYVHIDAKVKILPELHVRSARLKILSNRVKVYWGDWSVVEAEYALFEDAVANGPYDYYHLLSGVDLPLKSQDYIHSFCDNNQGKEFIGYTLTSITPEIVRKVQRYHLFPHSFKDAGFLRKALRAGCLRCQEVFGIKRNRDISFTKGSQWVSVTERMARLFLESREWAEKTFRNTFCSDEIVFQTLCWNSHLKENIYDTEYDGKGCMRAIGWRDGRLYDWTDEDYEMLAASDALFARKFNGRDNYFLSKIEELSKKGIIYNYSSFASE